MDDVAAVPTTLARALDDHGEVVLRLRPPGTYELVVNGVFAMDTVDVATEELLASLALDRVRTPVGTPDAEDDGWAVLVGGLGLGFTTRRVLADPRVTAVRVAELHPAVVDWVRAGLVPAAAGLLDDRRLHVVVGDVGDVLASTAHGSLDAVLLDVDNGPDFLVHEHNDALYAAPFLHLVAGRLRPGGVLAVWSAGPSPALHAAVAEVMGGCDEVLHRVRREGRTFTYALYLAPARAPAEAAGAAPPTPGG